MPSNFSVSDILTDVARLSNAPPFSATTNVTDTQCLYWLSQSARSLSALLHDQHGDDREFIQFAVRTTSPGYDLVSLPDDADQVSAVLWRRGEQDLVLLDAASLDDLVLELDTGQGWTDTMPPRWRIEGDTIALYPASNDAEELQIYYTTHLSPTSGTFQARLDFDRWVTLDVCVKVATARRRDPGTFIRDREMLGKALLSRARKKDPHTVRTIRDTRYSAFRNVSRGPWWRL